MAGHSQRLDDRERPAGLQERGAGQIDQVHVLRTILGGRRLEERAELFAASRTELDEHRRRRLPQHVAAACGEETLLGRRDPVPGQPADRFEERGPELVVEIPRRKLTRLLQQVVLDVGCEPGQRRVGRRFGGRGSSRGGPAAHRTSLAHRNVA